jgi:phenylpyruvate tautomerase PptA (4-oxalocrotonate tautomerase family)
MPLTRVSLLKGKPPEYRRAILDGLYQAMREVFDAPEEDRFMMIEEYEKSNFLYGKNYLGIARDDDLMIVQITVNNTRGPEQKKALFARIAELLARNPGNQAGKRFGESFGSAKGKLVVWQRHRAICVSGEGPLRFLYRSADRASLRSVQAFETRS